MTDRELKEYIDSKNGLLNTDELLEVLDLKKNPQLDHIIFQGDVWKAWDCNGNYYEFRKSEE